ncbi:MAG: hypothetical protein QXL01_00070 [Thermoplasmatales archaeon]
MNFQVVSLIAALVLFAGGSYLAYKMIRFIFLKSNKQEDNCLTCDKTECAFPGCEKSEPSPADLVQKIERENKELDRQQKELSKKYAVVCQVVSLNKKKKAKKPLKKEVVKKIIKKKSKG